MYIILCLPWPWFPYIWWSSIFDLSCELQSCTSNSLLGITTGISSMYLILIMSKVEFFSKPAPPLGFFLSQWRHQLPRSYPCLLSLLHFLHSINQQIEPNLTLEISLNPYISHVVILVYAASLSVLWIFATILDSLPPLMPIQSIFHRTVRIIF